MTETPDASLLGERLATVRVRPPGPRSRELARRLGVVESRNVTAVGPDFPVFWEAARGANVRDVDGNVYVDLSGAFGVAASGHANPVVTERIAEQAGRLVHGMGDVHPPAVKVELLERLTALAPMAPARAVLASTGSEAVEIALKTALLATGRAGILAFEGGYHGLTLGALAATAREDFRGPFRDRLYRGVALAPFPDPRGGPEALARGLAAAGAALDTGAPGGDPIGAVIVEPVQGRAGVRIPPDGFLAGLADLARDAGALLVFDEVFTGFGRTGRRFACLHEEVAPDLLCVGKALGGGLPLSACVGSAEAMDAWPPSSGEALHTSTFLGHPLACTSALAFLDELEGRGLAERSARSGDRLRGRLAAALRDVHCVREIRGRGLFVGIELEATGTAVRAAEGALRAGVIVLPAGARGEVVELAPPLVITDEQMDFAADALAEVVRQVGRGGS